MRVVVGIEIATRLKPTSLTEGVCATALGAWALGHLSAGLGAPHIMRGKHDPEAEIWRVSALFTKERYQDGKASEPWNVQLYGKGQTTRKGSAVFQTGWVGVERQRSTLTVQAPAQSGVRESQAVEGRTWSAIRPK